MSEPFVGEIKMFAGNFAPRGYAYCDGQLLPIAQNTALFSLYGTTFGGDGRTTMGLPDLQGRAPMGQGQGPGLTSRQMGEKLGANTVTLTQQQMGSHTHTLNASSSPGEATDPTGNSLARTVGGAAYSAPDANQVEMAAGLQSQGSGAAHNNVQPYQVVSFICALVGLYPSRS